MRRIVIVALWTLMMTSAMAADPMPQQRIRIAAANSFLLRALPTSLPLRVLLTDTDRTLTGNTLSPDRNLPGLIDATKDSNDPLIRMVMAARCRATLDESLCDPVDMAKRWIAVDSQNQVAWMRLADTQGLADGNAEAIATFRRASEATRWDDRSVEVSRILLAVVPADTPQPLRVDVLETLRAAPMARASATELLQTVTAGCRRPELRDACLRILDAMARDAVNVWTLATATGLTRFVRGPEDVLKERQRPTDLAHATEAMVPTLRDDIIETATPEQMRTKTALLTDLMARGELAMLDDVRRRRGLSDTIVRQAPTSSMRGP